jgi:hypothetical protein
MAYFIIPNEASDLQIDPQNLANQLSSKWPFIKFENAVTQNDPFILSWRFDIDGDVLRGSLHKDGQTVSMEDFSEGAAKFAVWYREVIPPQYQLFISHDSSDEEIEIMPESTEEEILDDLNGL